ncbi:hypothetical protein JTB14_025944 [Gonioctena quinquepunctata]|nr:hypothetical protein JTB14_025944 [Gonioctena quinquepunctata]
MLRDSIEDPTESKFSPAHIWKNGNFNGLAEQKLDQTFLMDFQKSPKQCLNEIEKRMKHLWKKTMIIMR